MYVLDSNFFIESHRRYYPIDVVPGFWSKVKQLAEEERIISIDKVKEELYGKNDALENWCRANLPENFFKNTSDVMDSYVQVISWAKSKNHYLQNALNEFLGADEADAFLVAYCLADPTKNRLVVTQEISESKRKNKVKIPDVCIAFKLPCVDLIKMFRELRETF